MKKPLAILEGPHSTKLAGGWRHVAVICGRGYPSMCLALDGGRGIARVFNVKHYPVGTWEAGNLGDSFPMPRPEILTEIFGTKQKEMPV